MKEYVIGIGEIGLESISFFAKNYKNFPECALVLAGKERLNMRGHWKKQPLPHGTPSTFGAAFSREMTKSGSVCTKVTK